MKKMTALDPFVHGYKFTNRAVSVVGDVGVCGGMSWSMLDFFYHPEMVLPGYQSSSFPNATGALVPGWRSVPDDPVLCDYIWSRQDDSRNANWARFMGALTAPPNIAAELKRLKAGIDAGMPVPIGLPGTTPWVWDGHHVVACGYQDTPAGTELLIYDPNCEDRMMLLRVLRDDLAEEYACTYSAGNWSASGSVYTTWKGFFVADGYTPRTPPAGLQDLVVTGALQAPAAVETTGTCVVSFTVTNLGEFDTALHSLVLRLRSSAGVNDTLATPVSVGGVLPLHHSVTATFSFSPPNADWYDLEALFQRDAQDKPRPFQPRATRKILFTQGFPEDSWVEMGSLPPGPIASPVLGKQISGPSLGSPYKPRVFEVVEWQLRASAWVQDDYGGGSFVGSIAKADWSLDGGALQNRAPTVKPRQAELIATYKPIAGQDQTLLRVVLTDARGEKFEDHFPVKCGAEVELRTPEIRVPFEIPRGVPFGWNGLPGPDPRAGGPLVRPGPAVVVPMGTGVPQRRPGR